MTDPRIPIPQDAVWAEVKRERDQLRDEVERLEGALAAWLRDEADRLTLALGGEKAEVERLKQILARSDSEEEARLRAEAEQLQGQIHELGALGSREVLAHEQTKAEVDRLKAAVVEIEAAHLAAQAEVASNERRWQVAEERCAGYLRLTHAVHSERDDLRAQVQAMRKNLEDNARLRAALAEMLESFTEPEDDNDILRRARAALVRPNPP